MSEPGKRLALGIELPFINSSSQNFRPPTWPPEHDFPVVIDKNGVVISRYGDRVWDLSAWADRRLLLNFQNYNKNSKPLSKNSADMARLVTAWWLWGPRPVTNAGTLKARFQHLFPLFKLCSSEGVDVEMLYRKPEVIDKLLSAFSSSHAEPALILLHNLFEKRFEFGYTILDRESLRRLSAAISPHEGSQTAYIPPRIWLYQVNRLREFLVDYDACSEGVKNCYNECISLYESKFGSLDSLYVNGESRNLDESGFTKNFGPFINFAKKHGILANLQKWILGPNRPDHKCMITTLGSFMTLASKAGMAYLLNFSLMRVEEAWKLRSKCLVIENDPNFGHIYTLGGVTTKTLQDTDARWVTSPSAELAVKVLNHVVHLRMDTAKKRLGLTIPKEQMSNPWFNIRNYEPWARGNGMDKSFDVRPAYPAYQSVLKSFPLLFAKSEITIQESDIEYARLLTPSLGGSFVAGELWPFAWHQLRRTGAVNMQASGLVSDPSVQYQLKHTTRAMSLYYGRGFARVKLDDIAYATYLKAMYEVLGHEIARLLTPRFVSPYGENRKAQILNVVSASDAKKLALAAKKGLVSWRETLAGGCVKRGHCSLGGADTIIHCGGGHGKGPCPDALYDRDRIPELLDLHDVIEDRLTGAPVGSPYHQSLLMQNTAVRNIIDILEAAEK